MRAEINKANQAFLFALIWILKIFYDFLVIYLIKFIYFLYGFLTWKWSFWKNSRKLGVF